MFVFVFVVVELISGWEPRRGQVLASITAAVIWLALSLVRTEWAWNLVWISFEVGSQSRQCST